MSVFLPLAAGRLCAVLAGQQGAVLPVSLLASAVLIRGARKAHRPRGGIVLGAPFARETGTGRAGTTAGLPGGFLPRQHRPAPAPGHAKPLFARTARRATALSARPWR